MKVLLVLDMIDLYVYGDKPLINLKTRPKLIQNIKAAINHARKSKIKVIYINSAFVKTDPILKVIGNRKQAMKGSKHAGVIKELKPRSDDYVLEKRGFDGFWGSKLAAKLKTLRARDVYLVGEQTDCCIRETAVTAAHLGYNVYVIKECCDTSRPLGQESSLLFINRCAGTVIGLSDFKRI